MRKRALTLLLPVVIAIGVYLFIKPPSHPHRIYYNGNVLTMDGEQTVAEAIAIRDGLIEAVGTNAEMALWKTQKTELVDLRGKTLMPGFIDAHSHFPVSGLLAVTADLRPSPLGSINSIPKLLDAIKQYDARSDRDWVIGFGYDDSFLREQRHPTRAELDSAVHHKPVYIWHGSGHMGVANTRAIEALGITDATPNPLGGVIVRDPATGRANGLLLETAAPPMSRLLNTFSWLDMYKMLEHAVDEYRAAGITTAQNGGADTRLMRALYWAQKIRLIPFRLNIWANEKTLGRDILSGEIDPEDYKSDRFDISAIKLLADGSPQGHTAWLTRPYHTQRGRRGRSYRGFPLLTREQLYRRTLPYHKAGWQLAIHGNGDAAIDDIINLCDRLQRTHYRDDHRMILVHAQLARKDQLPRMESCGITPSFFSNHVYYWGDAHSTLHLGPIRAENISPAASALETGLLFTLHTDTPITPINQLQLLSSAVNRKTLSGEILGMDERISRQDALQSVTRNAAWQRFAGHKLGVLKPGYPADLIILSANPANGQTELRSIAVEQTIIGGIALSPGSARDTAAPAPATE